MFLKLSYDFIALSHTVSDITAYGSSFFTSTTTTLPYTLSSSFASFWGEGGTSLNTVIKKQQLWTYALVQTCFVFCSMFLSQSFLIVYLLSGSYWALKRRSCRTTVGPWLLPWMLTESATATINIKLGSPLPCVWLFIYLHCICLCCCVTQFIIVSIFHNSAPCYLWLCWPTCISR